MTLGGIGAEADRIEVDVPAGLPSVYGDPALFERSLDNVVTNALRHGGGVTDRDSLSGWSVMRSTCA